MGWFVAYPSHLASSSVALSYKDSDQLTVLNSYNRLRDHDLPHGTYSPNFMCAPLRKLIQAIQVLYFV